MEDDVGIVGEEEKKKEQGGGGKGGFRGGGRTRRQEHGLIREGHCRTACQIPAGGKHLAPQGHTLENQTWR